MIHRSRNSLAVLLSLAVVVLVSALSLAASIGLVTAGSASGARTVLSDAAPRAAAVQLTTHLADDPPVQDAAARTLFDGLFPAGTVAVDYSWRSGSVPLRLLGDAAAPADSTVVVGVVPALDDRVSFTAGDWEGDVGTVAVQADAAAELGLAPGDSLTVGSDSRPVTLTVAALWRATDAGDPAWFGDSAVASGRSGDSVGLLVVDAETALTLRTRYTAAWTVVGTPAATLPANRADLVRGLDRLGDDVRGPVGVMVESSGVKGSLAATIERIDVASRAAAAVATSAAFIVGVLALVALLQLSTVLATSRRRETLLLRARGLSTLQLAALAVGEAAVVALPAGVAGVGIAALVPGVATDVVVAAAVVGLLALATIGAVAATALVDARSVAPDAPPRDSPVVVVVTGALLVVAAALAVWQLHTRGTPVVAGGAPADLVAAASPALALVALAVIGAVLLVPVSGWLAAAAARRGSLPLVLATRQLARRTGRYLVPVLAIAIALAGGVFAAGLAATAVDTQRSALFVRTGAAVALDLGQPRPDDDGTRPTTAETYRQIDGVDAAAAVALGSAGIGADTVAFVGLRPDGASAVLGDDGRAFADALATTSTPDTSLALAAGASTIAATVTVTGREPATTEFAISVWVSDADGALARVPLVATPDPGVRAGALPAGVQPWRLLALESDRTGPADPRHPTVVVSDLTLDGAALNLAPVTLAVATTAATAREPVGETGEGLPVVVSSALAARIGLSVGDELELEYVPTNGDYTATVTAIVDRVPGSASRLAVATDLDTLGARSLATGRVPVVTTGVWYATATPDAVAAEVPLLATRDAAVSTASTTSSAPVVAASLSTFWIAAGTAGLLALIALAAFLLADARARRDDLGVLRALGLTPREQGAVRGWEQTVAIGTAVVVGAAGGLVATLVTVTPFAAAAVPGAVALVRIDPVFDIVPWLVFAGIVVAGVVVIVGLALLRVRRAAAVALDERGA
ncbi:FtsX-like permease family protein [Conyzicola lurida]|uniref:FtsX-like permease family protein n=1 Tax=Conyzicola lurida TaxID=1172621 RepID=UPI0016158A0C|nr:FtsX-like permease family protein [Conyzicola lurida]